MRRFENHKSVVLFLSVLALAFAIVSIHPSRGTSAQSVIGATSGSPGPTLNGNGAPSTVYVCDASSVNLIYFQLDGLPGQRFWMCNGATWIQGGSAIAVSGLYLNGTLQTAAKCAFYTGTTSGAGTITFNISALGATTIIGQPQPSVQATALSLVTISSSSTTSITLNAQSGVTVSIVGINATIFTVAAVPVGVYFFFV